MDIESFIQEKKILISSYLQTYLKQTALPYVSSVNKWGNDGVSRILTLITRGKMIRGSLVFLGQELFSKQSNPDAVLKTASALEILHTGLIIHDDIMDRDEIRRGGDSMYVQYRKLLKKDGIENAETAGESFAMCIGDLSFFLSFGMLSTVTPYDLGASLTALFSEELGKTCIAQMQDVYGGSVKKHVSKENILSVYAYKTGRYSCGLPLVAGALIGGAHNETVKQLWKVGTALGILFQIKDDELNLFGDTKKTGKPTGSDIREGKQTLYRLFLMEKADLKMQEKLRSLFGNPKITQEDIALVRKKIEALGIEKDIDAITQKQKEIITEVLTHLPLRKDGRILLEKFISYITEREK